MVNCIKDCDLQTIGMPAQAEMTKIFINSTQELQSCVKIKGNEYITTEQDGITPLDLMWYQHAKNTDLLNCPDALCVTNGRQELNATNKESQGEDYGTIPINGLGYVIEQDPAMFAEGVVTANITFEQNGTFGVDTYLYANGDRANADNYVKYFTVTNAPEERSLMIDLTTVPTNIDGTGWDKTGIPTNLLIRFVDMENPTGTVSKIQVANIQLWKTPLVFAQNDTAVITCIDGIDFDPSVDPTDPTCLGSKLDPSSTTLDLTIHARQYTSNFLKLTAWLKMSDEVTTESEIVCVGETLTDSTNVLLPNFNFEECGYIMAQSEACTAEEGQLAYSTIEDGVAPVGNTFKIITINGNKYAQFPETYLGAKVTITYPKTVQAIVYDGTDDFTGAKPARLTWPINYAGGRKRRVEVYAYLNFTPLSFSTTEDQTSDITVAPTKMHGRYFRLLEYIED